MRSCTKPKHVSFTKHHAKPLPTSLMCILHNMMQWWNTIDFALKYSFWAMSQKDIFPFLTANVLYRNEWKQLYKQNILRRWGKKCNTEWAGGMGHVTFISLAFPYKYKYFISQFKNLSSMLIICFSIFFVINVKIK